MKKTILALSIAAAAMLAMTGCSSSSKLGSFCYISHGVSGQCTAATMEPGTAPSAARVAPQPATAPKPPTPGA